MDRKQRDEVQHTIEQGLQRRGIRERAELTTTPGARKTRKTPSSSYKLKLGSWESPRSGSSPGLSYCQALQVIVTSTGPLCPDPRSRTVY